MFCPNCGKENPDGVVRCEQCAEPLPAPKTTGSNTPPQEQVPPAQQTYTPPAQEYTPSQQTYTPAPPPPQPQPYGQPAYGQVGYSNAGFAPPMPKNYLVGNIIFTVLGCCSMVSVINLILGIIGIIFSAQVKSKYNTGDHAGAEQASKVAKIMFIVNMILTLIGIIIAIIYAIYILTSGMMDYYMYDFYDYFALILY